MFKFTALFAFVALASATPGFVVKNHNAVAQSATLTKTAIVDTSVSSAFIHQTFTNLEKKLPIVYNYAVSPMVKTIATPIVHIYKTVPIVKTVATPVVHTYAAAPLIKTIATPVVHTYAAAPVVKTVLHSVPVVKTVIALPIFYTNLHH